MPRKGGPVHSQFQPGRSGNPAGRPPLSPELKAIKELTQDEIKRTFSKFLRMPKYEMEAFIKDSTNQAWELTIVSGLLRGLSIGDFTNMLHAFDRIVGKVKDVAQIEVRNWDEEFEKVPRENIIEMLKKDVSNAA